MPTREGTVLGLVAIAIFLLATNLMSGLLFVLDAVLIALALVGLVTALAPLPGLTVTRRAPAHGVEGQAVPIEVTIRAKRRARFLVIEDGWPGARARALLPAIGPGHASTVIVRPLGGRRGRFVFGPVEMTSRGAVGLFVARRSVVSPHQIVIQPRISPIPGTVLAHLAPAFEGQTDGRRTREPVEVYSVRDYRPGDSLAHVHWRSSARRGALVVREFEEPATPRITVVLDLDRSQPPARLDAAVRAAASLFAAGRQARVNAAVAGWAGELVQHQAWDEAMDWLAVAEPSGPPVREVIGSLRDRLPGHLIVVAASARLPALPGLTAVVSADQAGPHDALIYAPDGEVRAW